ncbi:MAG: hypothetical protein RLO17_19755 [Cyclobacteriaceae bacterium]
MEFKVYSRSEQNLRKVLQWIILILIILCFGAMVRGVGSYETLYSRWEMPFYAYLFTWIILFFLSVIWLNLMFSPIGKSSVILVNNSVLIKKGLFKSEMDVTSKVQEISRDYSSWASNSEPGSIWTIEMIDLNNIQFIVPKDEGTAVEEFSKQFSRLPK